MSQNDRKNLFATYPHPAIGGCRIDYVGDMIVGVQLGVGLSAESARTTLTDSLFRQICEYLAGERREFDTPIETTALTPFQQRVLTAIRNIPYGERRTYQDIAIAIGSPRAARAVGSACNRNPYLLIIPCHRVVGRSGALTGYVAGLELKRKLLALEESSKARG